MWNNEDWAASHIKKHEVKPNEAWEIFEKCTHPLKSEDQLRFPPYRRYWTIGCTEFGRTLLIVWEQHRDILNLITAFEPNKEIVRLYYMKGKSKKVGKSLEAHWEKVAALYENPKTAIKMLEQSKPLTAAERRKYLGRAKTKAISIRIPEDDLVALKTIADQNDRKYQQLIILAIEQYLDQFVHR